MDDKTNFWAVLVAPWARKNPYRLAFYIFVFVYLLLACIWAINSLTLGRVNSIHAWWFFFPLILSFFFLITFLVVRRLVENVGKKMPQDSLLRSHCVVVHGILEAAGLVQITQDHLLIQPLLGSRISIPLRQISAITEHRWYNGRPYLGSTMFFELMVPKTVSGKWRLGFGVEDAQQWRKLLSAPGNAA